MNVLRMQKNNYLVKQTIAFAVVLLVLFTSCGEETLYSNAYRCNFRFNTEIHNNTVLNQVTNPLIPGTYVRVSLSVRGSVRHVDLLTGTGTSESVPLTTAEERMQTYDMGADNGIIVGRSVYHGLLAFDAQCPNCLSENSGGSFPLSFHGNGTQMTCAHCHRVYDLNERGVVVSGEKGKKLMEYAAQYTGRLLLVHNKY